jgi:hypothetical protein
VRRVCGTHVPQKLRSVVAARMRRAYDADSALAAEAEPPESGQRTFTPATAPLGFATLTLQPGVGIARTSAITSMFTTNPGDKIENMQPLKLARSRSRGCSPPCG